MSWDRNVKVFLNHCIQLAADFWAVSLSSQPKTEEREDTTSLTLELGSISEYY